MIDVKIKNSYHDTVEIAEGKNLEEVKKNHIDVLKIKAEWLAENEVEEDWEEYYPTYEEAFNATYELILEQLISEVSFEILK